MCQPFFLFACFERLTEPSQFLPLVSSGGEAARPDRSWPSDNPAGRSSLAGGPTPVETIHLSERRASIPGKPGGAPGTTQAFPWRPKQNVTEEFHLARRPVCAATSTPQIRSEPPKRSPECTSAPPR